MSRQNPAPATYCSNRTFTIKAPEQEKPRHPAFMRWSVTHDPKNKRQRPRLEVFVERKVLTREQVAARVTSDDHLRRNRPIYQCETNHWYCGDLDGARCGYYGDELETRYRMRRRCDECIEQKGK